MVRSAFVSDLAVEQDTGLTLAAIPGDEPNN